MKKPFVRTLSLLLLLLFCLGCRSVSVVSDTSGTDLSTVIPEANNPNNYINIVRYAPIPTDKGIFHIVREENSDYVSFLTDEGEEIRLLQGIRFANLQLVQPYLYVVDFGTRDLSDAHSWDYAKLYRLDLSDRSLFCFPRYTVRYYALSSGEILRVNMISGSGYTELYRSDWSGSNNQMIQSDYYFYNPIPQGDTVEWVHYDPVYESGVGDNLRIMRFTPERNVETEAVWTDTEGGTWSEGVFLYDQRKYHIVCGAPDSYEDEATRPITVYALSDDGSRTVLLETSLHYNTRLYPKRNLILIPENAVNRIIDTVHPYVILYEPLENGLCLFGIASNHEIKIYTFDNLVSYYDVDDGAETLIPLDMNEQN